jgi:hypothetical protein
MSMAIKCPIHRTNKCVTGRNNAILSNMRNRADFPMLAGFWRSQNPPGSKLPIINTRNLEQPPWCYVLWGVPALLAFVGSYAYSHSLLTVTEAGIFWTVSVAWIGTGCFLNGRSCGRVHCLIDGIAFSVLSFVGALGVISVIAINWSLFWAAFFVILAASFGVEFVWGRYSNKVWRRYSNQLR